MTIMIILKDKKTSSHLRNDESYTDHTKKHGVNVVTGDSIASW